MTASSSISVFRAAIGAAAMILAGAASQAQASSLTDYCEDQAYRAAWRSGSSNAVGQGAVTGAVAGGLLGAILGHGHGRNIVGGAVAGTAAGALLGAAGSRQGYIDRRAYRISYNNCMARNRPAAAVSYSGAVRYCMSKYRSYNPETGLYVTYDGRRRPCP